MELSNFFQGLVDSVVTYLQTFLHEYLTGLIGNILP